MSEYKIRQGIWLADQDIYMDCYQIIFILQLTAGKTPPPMRVWDMTSSNLIVRFQWC